MRKFAGGNGQTCHDRDGTATSDVPTPSQVRQLAASGGGSHVASIC